MEDKLRAGAAVADIGCGLGASTILLAQGYPNSQAGEAAIRQVVTDAGFTRFRRAAETPFNLVYEVRP